MNPSETQQILPLMTPESGAPRNGLRKRLKLASTPVEATAEESKEAPPAPRDLLSEPLLPESAGMPETPSSPQASLVETAHEIARELEQTAERMVRELRETGEESARLSEVQVRSALGRLTELQRSLGEAEHNLAYTVERLRRENGRAGWMQTGVIVLALLAGTLGGTAAALLILVWIR